MSLVAAMDMGKSVQLPLPRVQSSQMSRFPRRASFRIPDKFKDGADADEDVTAPKSKRSRYMNQSFISLIANVGSRPSFEPHFTLKDSRQSDGLSDGDSYASADGSEQQWRVSGTVAQRDRLPQEKSTTILSEREPSRSVPELHDQSQDTETQDDSINEDMYSSQILTPYFTSSQAPQESLKRLEMAQSPDTSSPISRPETQPSPEPEISLAASGELMVDKPSIGLDQRLSQAFGLEPPERVVAEYPCWLLQNVLLQGHMYITPRHVCYYAYLPRKDDKATKSGILFKRGTHNPRYSEFWCVLKGTVLSYYSDPSKLYFPHGNIDLRKAMSAETVGVEQPRSTTFSITTAQRTHLFKAGSARSAREWVKQIQKVIFRTRNESDSVKILLPIGNIMDIESNPVAEFADTFRVRTIDNDETFAIDEYFFSFFHGGQDVLGKLRSLVHKNGARTGNTAAYNSKPSTLKSDDERLHTTQNMDAMERTEFDSKIVAPKPNMEPQSSSASSDDFDVTAGASPDLGQPISASQMLQRSDMFHMPANVPGQKSSWPSSVTDNRSDDAEDSLNVASGVSRLYSDSCRSSKENSGSNSGNSADTTPMSASKATMRGGLPSSSFRDIYKAGTEPLNKASGIAGLLWTRSQRMRDTLSAESKGYYDKVSDMWAGQTIHYDNSEGFRSLDTSNVPNDNAPYAAQAEEFRDYFALPDDEKLIATSRCHFEKPLPVYGTLFLGTTKLCFMCNIPGTRNNIIIPLQDIENVVKTNLKVLYSSLAVVIRGHEELVFDFSRRDARDDFAVTLLQCLESVKDLSESGLLGQKGQLESEAAKAEYEQLEYARRNNSKDGEQLFQSIVIDPENESPPVLFDDDQASVVDFKPAKPQNITCLTIGSQGDVQPYIALCKGLIVEGHKPKIATHAEFEPWIRYHGIDFQPIAGDPQEIMRLCVEHDMFTMSFIREVSSKFRGWMDQLLESSWKACQGSDILIESPSAMAGIHVAEALQIPYFRAFTMPWTQTRAYPHAFIVPSHKLGGSYNKMTYMIFERVFWHAQSGQVNRWRARHLGLAPTSLEKMQLNKVPFIYNFSPSVVTPPLDFNPWTRVTGYWFLDEGQNYEPSKDLIEFIVKARSDGKKLAYVGFGSIVLDDPGALTKTVVDSVLKADVRCILSKGWSQRLGRPEASEPEFPLPPEIFQIKRAPHDWLFTQIDAAAHHGGAGTTGASLRAGLPTIVRPFFGDQWFFGSRVEDLGVGICLRKINTSVFARALWEATNSERMIVKARLLGEQIRAEDGVGNAIKALYRDLDYAKSLVKTQDTRPDRTSEESHESWTMVGEENDF